MSQEDIANIIERLEQLEVQAQEVATSIATERSNLREALRNAEAARQAEARQQPPAAPVRIGDTVRFSSTTAVRGGTGEVIGVTNGAQPFLRIRRAEGRGLLRREIVRRKPHTVQVIHRAAQ